MAPCVKVERVVMVFVVAAWHLTTMGGCDIQEGFGNRHRLGFICWPAACELLLPFLHGHDAVGPADSHAIVPYLCLFLAGEHGVWNTGGWVANEHAVITGEHIGQLGWGHIITS